MQFSIKVNDNTNSFSIIDIEYLSTFVVLNFEGLFLEFPCRERLGVGHDTHGVAVGYGGYFFQELITDNWLLFP